MENNNILDMIRNFLLGFIRTIVLIFAVVCALGLLVTAYSSYISPEFMSYVGAVGILFPVFVLLNVIVLIGGIVTWHRVTWVAVLALVLSFPALRIYCPIHFGKESHRFINLDEGRQFSLMTYNVMGFDTNYKKKGHNAIGDYLSKSGEDIICLQEAGYTKNKRYFTADDLRKALSDYPYYDNTARKNRLAFFSRYPIVKKWNFAEKDILPETRCYVIVMGKTNQDTVLVINNHMCSNKLTKENRIVFDSISRLYRDEQSMTKLHEIPQRLTEASVTRAKQVDLLKQKIDSLKKEYTHIIVCGDMNATPLSYLNRQLRKSLTNVYESVGNGIGTTYNKHRFYVRIDHVYVNENITPFSVEVDRSISTSDHYPLKCVFQLHD